MAIIGNVERRNWKVKLLNVMIHVVLILGASTMVYPLLLMLSGSFKSGVDFTDFTIWPKYFNEDAMLFRKHLDTKYNHNTVRIFNTFKEPTSTVESISVPARISEARVDDYREFLSKLKPSVPHYWRVIGMAVEPGVSAYTLRAFREWLQNDVYGQGEVGLAKLNAANGTDYGEWGEIMLPKEDFFAWRVNSNYSKGFLKLIKDFKDSDAVIPLSVCWPDVEGEFIAMLKRNCGNSLERINAFLGTDYNSWSEISISENLPENPRLAEQWNLFLRTYINPEFLVIDVVSAQKPWERFLESKYGSIEAAGADHTLVSAVIPPYPSSDDPNKAAAESALRNDWTTFVQADSTPEKLWRSFLAEKYKTPDALSAAYGVTYASFDDAAFPADISSVSSAPMKADYDALVKHVETLRMHELPSSALSIDTLANRYREFLATKYPGGLSSINEAYGNGFKSFDEVSLPELSPGDGNLAETRDRGEFLNTLKPEEVALVGTAAMDYKKFIMAKYTRDGAVDFNAMSRDYGHSITNPNEVPAYIVYPSDKIRRTDKARADYVEAIRSGLFDSMRRIAHPEKYVERYRAFLAEKYSNDISRLNNSWHLVHRSYAGISVPSKEYEFSMMLENRAMLVKEYLKRNYLMVFDTLVTNGNAALNTIIYCFLSVFAALLVNPLCAYGLSRYKPASSYKILLFLMLPMAFPGMVLGIPQFLLIKDFGLLNTFAALILPGMANGYSIFLLKGFFDSLPKELFESAAIDGASEWTVFWHIAMGLSTPILSVIALGAFTGAYGNFMMAFLMCQKKSMWTMMVYLYQLQQQASPAVGFAALIIAAIPTLIVFIFCQNIIIKGIVVPTEK